MMKANELTFGIEVECFIPNEHYSSFQAGGYHRGLQIQDSPQGWNSQADGSLVAPTGYKAVEVASPILSGEDGLCQVFYMAEYLQRVGAVFNGTAGLHIHVSGRHLTINQQRKLAKLYRKHEGAFLALCGEGAGYRASSRFCATSPNWSRLVDLGNRYRSLNFTNLNGGKGTVEFRVFYPDSSPELLLTAVYMAVGLVAKVSQMDEQEANELTSYPRPGTMKDHAYRFIRDIWNRRSNLLIPDARAKDVYSVLLAQAEKSVSIQHVWNEIITQRWGQSWG